LKTRGDSLLRETLLAELRQQLSDADTILARARRLLLRIDAASRQVELVLPYGVPAEHGLKFLAAQRGWITARLEALPIPVPFAEGAIVPVFGLPHRISRETDPAAPPVV